MPDVDPSPPQTHTRTPVGTGAHPHFDTNYTTQA